MLSSCDMALVFADIRKEFDESLGYIRQDIAWLCEHNSGLNYTVALLIGCACEALADGGAFPSKERALAELLPDAEWKQLAKPLFDALRNGLAHSFDTKHIHVDGEVVQIYIHWSMSEIIKIKAVSGGKDGLFIGARPLAAKVCQAIDHFEASLQSDDEACQRFRNALQRDRTVACSPTLWQQLKQKN
jgi:hypothetical protein